MSFRCDTFIPNEVPLVLLTRYFDVSDDGEQKRPTFTWEIASRTWERMESYLQSYHWKKLFLGNGYLLCIWWSIYHHNHCIGKASWTYDHLCGTYSDNGDMYCVETSMQPWTRGYAVGYPDEYFRWFMDVELDEGGPHKGTHVVCLIGLWPIWVLAMADVKMFNAYPQPVNTAYHGKERSLSI